MKTLFIDTHFKDINICLYKDGNVVNKCEIINKKNNSEYIFPSLINVIEDSVIDEIIVVIGPGSFTGVRLGVTIAKTMAYCLNVPIKTITSLECIAVSNNLYKVALSDNNGYFLANFDINYHLMGEYIYVNKEEFDNNYSSYNCVTKIDYNKIYNFVINNKENVNPHMVKPIYVKKIGVEK